MTIQTEHPLLLSVDRAAELAGIGRSILYTRLLSGEIRSLKIGRRRLVERGAILDYIARLTAEQVSA